MACSRTYYYIRSFCHYRARKLSRQWPMLDLFYITSISIDLRLLLECNFVRMIIDKLVYIESFECIEAVGIREVIARNHR